MSRKVVKGKETQKEEKQKEKPEKDKGLRISVWTLVFTIISLIACVVIGIYSSYTAEKIAKRSGAFSKGDLEVYIANLNLLNGITNKVIFAYPSEKGSKVFAQLPIYLRNNGEKTIEDITLHIKFPKIANMAFDTDKLNLHYDVFGLKANSMSHEFKTIGNFDIVVYHIPSLHPKQVLKINEPIHLVESITTPVDINIGKEALMVKISYGIDLNVFAKDIQEVEKKTTLETIQSSDMSDLKSQYRRQLRFQAETERSKYSLLQYATLLLKDNKVNDSVLILPKYRLVKTGVGNAYISSTEEPEVSSITYELISKTFLFN